jgi:hypothetical protein
MKAWYTEEYRDDIFFPWEKPDHYARVEEVMDRIGEPCKALLEWFYYRQKDWESIARRWVTRRCLSPQPEIQMLEKIRSHVKS